MHPAATSHCFRGCIHLGNGVDVASKIAAVWQGMRVRLGTKGLSEQLVERAGGMVEVYCFPTEGLAELL